MEKMGRSLGGKFLNANKIKTSDNVLAFKNKLIVKIVIMKSFLGE